MLTLTSSRQTHPPSFPDLPRNVHTQKPHLNAHYERTSFINPCASHHPLKNHTAHNRVCVYAYSPPHTKSTQTPDTTYHDPIPHTCPPLLPFTTYTPITQHCENIQYSIITLPPSTQDISPFPNSPTPSPTYSPNPFPTQPPHQLFINSVYPSTPPTPNRATMHSYSTHYVCVQSSPIQSSPTGTKMAMGWDGKGCICQLKHTRTDLSSQLLGYEDG